MNGRFIHFRSGAAKGKPPIGGSMRRKALMNDLDVRQPEWLHLEIEPCRQRDIVESCASGCRIERRSIECLSSETCR
ncbi:hypothetical protein [Luteimonas panaciterrae]|uniref:hypothetical protein n=1 Tax=Luteimonas panaciterrae TaxID=363885 RepID=UPI001CF9E897|nr:hypothetical protein [Luteimonas panaciterrae]